MAVTRFTGKTESDAVMNGHGAGNSEHRNSVCSD